MTLGDYQGNQIHPLNDHQLDNAAKLVLSNHLYLWPIKTSPVLWTTTNLRFVLTRILATKWQIPPNSRKWASPRGQRL